MGEVSLVKDVLLNWGLGIALSLGIFALCAYLVKQIIKTQEQERLRWIEMAENHIKHNSDIMSNLCAGIQEHKSKSDEAAKWNRTEHEQLCSLVGRCQDSRKDENSKLTDILQKIEIHLVKMNGTS